MDKAVIIWLILVIAFAVIEGLTAQLTTIWFAVGALVALIAATLHAPGWLQIVLFVVASVLVLVFLRPLVKKLLATMKTATNADRVIGKIAPVTEEIDNIKGTGEVLTGGVRWSARSEDGNPIPAGTTVEVLRIEGVKLYVRPLNSAEQEHKNKGAEEKARVE